MALGLLADVQASLDRLMNKLGVVDGPDQGAPPSPTEPGQEKSPSRTRKAGASGKRKVLPRQRRVAQAKIANPPIALDGRAAPTPLQPLTATDKTAPPTPDLRPEELAERLAKGYNKKEMIDLAFGLGFQVDHLAEQESDPSAARILVLYMDRRGQLPALVEKARQERPHLFPE
jgi:hypothetical protein